MKLIHTITLLGLLTVGPLALAQHQGMAMEKTLPAHTMSADAAQALTAGEVRKVDKSTQKITLKHGEIKNLDMPPMTMVFQVQDAALLDKVQAGDQVRFTADKINGAFVVLSIEPVKN